MDNPATTEAEQSAITLTTVIYALYAASYFVGVTAISCNRDELCQEGRRGRNISGESLSLANQDFLVRSALGCAGDNHDGVHYRVVCACR